MENYLAKIPLFRTLPAEELRRIGNACELRRFRKGETLFREGEHARAVWLIQRGWVHLVKRTPAGVPVTVFVVTPEEVLCGFSAAAGEGTYYASAVAATDTTALKIPRAEFAALLQEHPGFARAVLAIYHTRMRRMAETISLASAPVEQRLANVLLRLRGTFGNTVPIIHQELARMVGARLETSIRTVAVLKRRGWLATSRGRIVIRHPERLKTLLAPSARRDGTVNRQASK
jgi:CRP/FNR family transcriptional regulator